MPIDRVLMKPALSMTRMIWMICILGPKEFPLSFNESKEDAENLFEQISAETKLKAFSC